MLTFTSTALKILISVESFWLNIIKWLDGIFKAFFKKKKKQKFQCQIMIF